MWRKAVEAFSCLALSLSTPVSAAVSFSMFQTGTGLTSVTATPGSTISITTRIDATESEAVSAVTYYFVLPSEHWAIPLAIEADRMWNCDLGPSPFETERGVALEERAMLDDDPEALAFEALDALAFEGHPYAYPVVGLTEDLESLFLRLFRGDGE